MAAHQDRIKRLQKLAGQIPSNGEADRCPDVSRLLEKIGSLYGEETSPEARRRAIQRDLQELLADGRIDVVNPGGKPLRYRRNKRAAIEDDSHPCVLELMRQTVRNVVEAEFPAGHIDAVWRALLESDTNVGLGQEKMRVVRDTQRLLPAPIKPKVLADALEALALSKTLTASYRDRAEKKTTPTLHPQAFVLRGPRAYLYALKDDETEPVRMYALHRFVTTEVGDVAARQATGFDLDASINSGQADFADGQPIDLELRARGYVADLLYDCPLSEGQTIIDEPEGSDFKVRVSARVPGTGQLLRWVLGCGANVEVLAPDHLRHTVAVQVAKMASFYQESAELTDSV